MYPHHIAYIFKYVYVQYAACMLNEIQIRAQTKHVTHSHSSDADAASNRAHTNNTYLPRKVKNLKKN